MLTSVELENVLSWQKATIPLSPLCVLVGPNASGKTSVLEAIAQAAAALESVALGGSWPDVSQLLRRGSKTLRIALNASDPVEMLEVWLESSQVSIRFRGPRLSYESMRPSNLATDDARETVKRWTARLLRFLPAELAANSYSDVEVPRIGENGANLSSFLSYLKLDNADRFAALERDLKEIVPAVRGVRVLRAPVNRRETRVLTIDGVSTIYEEAKRYMGAGYALDMDGVGEVPPARAGEGTLLVLGLIAAVHAYGNTGLSLIDDVEMRLHPAAQAQLVRLLRRFVAGGRQVIGTTHSPFFLQHLEATEVTVVDRSDGVSTARRLSEHPDFERWKSTMGVGEFWSSVGEQWLRKTG